jgi:3-hydroxyacyl-CoA dehydrogenase
MRPLALLTMVGPAVALHVSETMHAAFPDRFGVSANLARIVASGKSLTDRDGAIDESAVALLAVGDAPLTAEQVRENALDAVADEVRMMLADGVVADAKDIDLCLILGAGWPFHLGGITPYLAATGRR